MKLVYTGPHTGVVVPLPDGRELECEHGKESPDFPADFASSLLEQESNWAIPEPERPAEAKPDKPKSTGAAGRRGGVSNGS